MKPIVSFFNAFCLVVVFFTTSLHTTNAQVVNDTLLAYRYYQKADSLLADKKYEKSIELFKKALPVYEKEKVWERAVSCYNKISQNQWRSRKLKESMQTAIKVLEIIDSHLIKDNQHEANAYDNLGNYYQRILDYDNAILYFEKALIIRQQLFSEYHTYIATSYNNLAIVYYHISKLEKATLYFEKSLKININVLGYDHPKTGSIYNNISNLYRRLGKLNKALDFAKKSFSIRLKTYEEDHINIGDSYMNIALIYYSLLQYDKALSYSQKAIPIYIKSEDLNRQSKIYNNIGAILRIKGEHNKALQYFKKSQRIGLKIHKKHHPSIADIYTNIGIVYDNKKEYQNAIDYYTKALDIYEAIYSKDNIELADIYQNLGYVFTSKGEYDIALEYYKKTLIIRKKFFDGDHYKIVNSYEGLTRIYYLKKTYDEALLYAEKSLYILKKKHGENHLLTSNTYNTIAMIYGKQKKYIKAITYFDKALLANAKNNDQKKDNETFDHDQYFNWMQLLTTLPEKSKSLLSLYQQNKNKQYLDQSIAIYKNLDIIIDHIRQTFTNYGDKVSFAKKAKEIYQEAIKAQLLLNSFINDPKSLEKAFYYTEKSKANTLKELLTDAGAKNFARIPIDLVTLEKELKTYRAFYQSKIIEEQSEKEIDTTKSIYYESELFYVNRRQDSLTQILEKNYPKYYQFKYENSVVSVADIQEQLEDNTTLLEFFTADSTTYAFTISKNDMAVHELATPKLTDKVEAFRASIISKDVATYKKQAHLLYTTLIAPVANKLVGDNLIIIPDASLWHLNFDLLLTKKDDSNNPALLSYMLREYAITYANSANLLFQDFKNETETKTAPQCLAFSFSDSTQITEAQTMRLAALRNTGADLPGTRKEIKAISNIIDGEYYFGSNAIEANFKKNADRYAIIHLALHGEVDNEHPENSKLFFTKTKDTLEDNNLYSHELFALDIPAELAVLSACNTGTGKIAKGEGIMSLGTAFQYAGTKSLLLTSWEVSDKTTPEIMQYFYTNLKAGMNKGKALQQAKLQYLTTADINRTDPFYWGGFYLVGNPDPMHFADNTLVYWILGLGILSILVFVGWQYRKRLKNR